MSAKKQLANQSGRLQPRPSFVPRKGGPEREWQRYVHADRFFAANRITQGAKDRIRIGVPLYPGGEVTSRFCGARAERIRTSVWLELVSAHSKHEQLVLNKPSRMRGLGSASSEPGTLLIPLVRVVR